MPPPRSLIFAMCVMTAVAVGIGVVVGCLLKRRPARQTNLVAAVGAVLLVAHALWLNGNPTLVHFVRSADAIVWSNFSPQFVAILIAAAWRAMTVRWQRWFVAIALVAIGLAQAYAPLFGHVPITESPRIANGIHHQSTLTTCSAATAATLLETIGIHTNETEMTALCLAREGGTLQLGLYRGLQMRAPGAQVEFLNDDIDAVLASDRPVIVSLGSPRPRCSILQMRAGHSVVILGHRTDGNLEIADSMTGGRYSMTSVEFRRNWTGVAMRLNQPVEKLQTQSSEVEK